MGKNVNRCTRHPSQPYFLFNSAGDGFSYFATPEERDAFAKSEIERYFDDGWDEEVTEVFAGKVTHEVAQIDRVERPDNINEDGDDEEDEHWEDHWEYKCNYKLGKLDE